jgi:hypothetical protein
MNATVEGDYNLTAKNVHATVAENIEMVATNLTGKFDGNGMLSTHGNFMIAGDGDTILASTSGTLSLGASKDIGIRSVGAGVHVQSSNDINLKSSSKLNMQSTGKASLKSAGTVAIEGPSAIQLNTSGEADDADEASQKVKAKPAPKTKTVNDSFTNPPTKGQYNIA